MIVTEVTNSLIPYQEKYLAHEITRRFPSDGVENFADAWVNTQVDLNSHLVDAGLSRGPRYRQ